MTTEEFILAVKLAGLEPREGTLPHLVDIYYKQKYGNEMLLSCLHLGGVKGEDLDRTFDFVISRARAAGAWG